ncbi:RNA polymerase primary sigma factor [Curtobacterium sp. PhB130]|uniref:sigma-70 family RNA polymerase sigma factor n=1 Tax=unclassified Curtobacterium TaxID=257496 RepID=UPI000F4CD6DD|nr:MULTISPECIES: sigma-70 family RNA polymerase sigma factor [unclassified Curtobacterium]ROP63663.1 RNA polymerase primary sigma factor [Curtobacterium sp. ZW137]ROS77923.1 RNA polymerase primary sigma factor [Curtobacterium sp. PhB130]TCK65866.1 RNA polymerase primary sigma factor [Curtobacterium sp. PhB136]
MTIATAAPSTSSRRTKKATAKTDSAKVESTTLDTAAAEVEADEQLAGVRGASVDQVGDYLRHIGRLSLLTAEEEADIARRIEVGLFAGEKLATEQGLPKALQRELKWLVRDGERAKERMITSNLRLVVSIAKRYSQRGLPFMDVIQEGNLGLVRAVEKFDFTQGYKFSTYATWWIRQAISRGLADKARTIRIPVHTVELINKISRTERDLTVDLGRAPMPEEVAAELSMSVEELVDLKGRSHEPVSIHTVVGDSDDSELGDFIEDEDAASPNELTETTLLHRDIRSIVAELPSDEANVIRMRYGLDDDKPMTLDEISKIVHTTRQAVSRVESRAKLRLFAKAVSQDMQLYLTE